MSSRPPSDRAPHGRAPRRTAVVSPGRPSSGPASRPSPRPRSEPVTEPFVAVPRQRSEPATERFAAVPPQGPSGGAAPRPVPEPAAAQDGLLVRLPDLELTDVPPDPPADSPPSRPTKLVVPGQRGPQPRKRSRRPVLIVGACVAAAMIGLTAVTGLVSALSSEPPVVAPTSTTTTTSP